MMLLILLAAAAPAAADERRTITTLPDESFLDSHGGVNLVSVVQEGGRGLALVRDGTVEPLPLAPGMSHADLGTDARGRLAVVFTRCERDCDVFLHRIGTTTETPLQRTLASETAPTIWRGRLAWARGASVFTRRLGSRRERRLAGVPRRRCDLRFDESQPCRLKERRVDDLELRGGRLAQVVSYVAPGGSGHFQSEVRLATLDGRSRRIASNATGEGGQQLVGLSFPAGRLGWHRSCFGDPCRGRAYRYDLGSRRYQIADGGHFSGFALTRAGFLGIDGGRELGVEDPEDCGASGCPIVEVTGVEWRRAEARRVRD